MEGNIKQGRKGPVRKGVGSRLDDVSPAPGAVVRQPCRGACAGGMAVNRRAAPPDPTPVQPIPLLFVEPQSAEPLGAADAAVPAPAAAPALSQIPPTPSEPARSLGDPPPTPQVSDIPEPTAPTTAAKKTSQTALPVVWQAPPGGPPATPPSDLAPVPATKPGPPAKTQARPPG